MTSRHVRKNRRFWNATAAEYQREHARQLNTWDRPVWGVWAIPESKLNVLGDVHGRRVLELGCGGGQWSIYLARKGALPVGLDLSIEQLRHAPGLMADSEVSFPVVNANAEATPFADESFDVVFCDHNTAKVVRTKTASSKAGVVPAGERHRDVGSQGRRRAWPILMCIWGSHLCADGPRRLLG